MMIFTTTTGYIIRLPLRLDTLRLICALEYSTLCSRLLALYLLSYRARCVASQGFGLRGAPPSQPTLWPYQ
jgi:hypothetical protein